MYDWQIFPPILWVAFHALDFFFSCLIWGHSQDITIAFQTLPPFFFFKSSWCAFRVENTRVNGSLHAQEFLTLASESNGTFCHMLCFCSASACLCPEDGIPHEAARQASFAKGTKELVTTGSPFISRSESTTDVLTTDLACSSLGQPHQILQGSL